MKCPICKLENPPSAERCDCGYILLADPKYKSIRVKRGKMLKHPVLIAIGGLTAILMIWMHNIRSLYALAVLAYFLPGFMAAIRDKRDKNAILLLNLFLGWTVIGWIAALIWTVTFDTPADHTNS